MKVIFISSSSNGVHLSELHHTEKILRHDVASFPLAMICEFSKLLLTSITSHKTLNISTLKLRNCNRKPFSLSVPSSRRYATDIFCVFFSCKKLTRILRLRDIFTIEKINLEFFSTISVVFLAFYSNNSFFFRCCGKEEGKFVHFYVRRE